MEIETFVLCDAATDYRGKLNILGTFDTIHAGKTPLVWPHCALALRLRFSAIETGSHPVRINFIDDDGQALLPPMEGKVEIRVRPGLTTIPANLILNIDRLKIEHFGEYSINLAVDGRQEANLPLYVRERSEPKAPEPRGLEDGREPF